MLKTIKETDPRITGEAWKTQDRKAVEAVLHGARVGEGSLTPQRIASLSGVELSAVRVIIKSMLTARQIVNAGTAQQPKYRMRGEAATNAAYHRDWGWHDGAELRPYTGRPGAMDAFNLPSLVQGQQVPARRPSAQLVGVLADRTTLARD